MVSLVRVHSDAVGGCQQADKTYRVAERYHGALGGVNREPTAWETHLPRPTWTYPNLGLSSLSSHPFGPSRSIHMLQQYLSWDLNDKACVLDRGMDQ